MIQDLPSYPQLLLTKTDRFGRFSLFSSSGLVGLGVRKRHCVGNAPIGDKLEATPAAFDRLVQWFAAVLHCSIAFQLAPVRIEAGLSPFDDPAPGRMQRTPPAESSPAIVLNRAIDRVNACSLHPRCLAIDAAVPPEAILI